MGVAASVAALAPTAVATMPAEGQVVSVADGHNITVFHNIDFVATFGHASGDVLTVTVQRNGVEIGSSGPAEVFAEDPAAPDWGLEVNHGPEGTPVDGDCWVGHTPDIRPGDLITVAGTGFSDSVRVDNIAFTGRPRELRNGDIVVPFNAYRANGRAIRPGFIDSAEFRAESNNQVRFEGPRSVRVERRPGAKPGQLWQRYPSPFRPARNDGFNQAELRRALLRDGHATGFGHVEVLPAESMLHDGLSDTPGPAIGCTGTPSARWEVSNVAPNAIGPGNRTRGFRASGRTFDASQVRVRLVDRDRGEPVRTVERLATVSDNQRSWTVQFRPRQLRALDGRFRVSSFHTFNGGTIGGPSMSATRNVR